MARNPWENDPDLQAFAGRRSGGMPWGRVLVGLVVVGGLTFVGAYYLPLFRAHDTLSAEHQRSVDQSHTLERSLADAKADLQKAAARRDELEAEKQKRESGSVSAASELEGLRSELSSKLDKAEKKSLAAVALKNGVLSVSLADALLFSPKKLEPSAGGKQVLCDVAKAAAARSIRILCAGRWRAARSDVCCQVPERVVVARRARGCSRRHARGQVWREADSARGAR
ncbi:MAG: hypothetical protein QM756_30960 [Polyangiaceae bacterium]